MYTLFINFTSDVLVITCVKATSMGYLTQPVASLSTELAKMIRKHITIFQMETTGSSWRATILSFNSLQQKSPHAENRKSRQRRNLSKPGLSGGVTPVLTRGTPVIATVVLMGAYPKTGHPHLGLGNSLPDTGVPPIWDWEIPIWNWDKSSAWNLGTTSPSGTRMLPWNGPGTSHWGIPS